MLEIKSIFLFGHKCTALQISSYANYALLRQILKSDPIP